ncbi:helix-turn-helix domain-containing protein [Rhodobacter capsulatus]|uniref:helix-turn-helix domain-containing protein n=1 Tax=Rhodobacter capsulatus TaxID=1061 RepID=UPI004028AC06
MINIAQIKAARLFLGWEQSDLADRSGVSLPTIQRLENPKFGPGRSRMEIVMRVIEALEAGGIEFIPPDGTKGCGVRLSRTDVKLEGGTEANPI